MPLQDKNNAPEKRHSRKRPVDPFSAHHDLPSPIKRPREATSEDEVTFLAPPTPTQAARKASRRASPARRKWEETENISRKRSRQGYKLRIRH